MATKTAKKPALHTPKGWTGRHAAEGVRVYATPSKTVCVRDYGSGEIIRYHVFVKVGGRWVQTAQFNALTKAVTQARKEAAAAKSRGSTCRLVQVAGHTRKCPGKSKSKAAGHKGHKTAGGGQKTHKKAGKQGNLL